MIKNLDKINLVKREKVKKGCEYIQKMNDKFPVVSKAVVFGSAVTNKCDDDSDIDICLYSNFDSSNSQFFQIYGNLPLVMDDICDILVYQKLTGKIKEEIDSKGVIVYEY